MASPAPHLTFRDVLKIPSVRRLWLAQLVSIFGDFLAIFAVFGLVTFQLHGTPTQVTMILVAYMLPLAIVSPLAGVFVDKWNVKWTMIASDLIRGVLVLVLIFVRDLNTIYGIFLALSTVSSFFVPAQSVAVRAIAPAAGSRPQAYRNAASPQVKRDIVKRNSTSNHYQSRAVCSNIFKTALAE